MRYWTSILVILLLTPSVVAQIQIGTLRGVVTDPNGARLTNATVALNDPLSGHEATTVTDGTGVFVFNNVHFGRYEVRVALAGFSSSSQRVTVKSNLPLQLSVSLNIAGTTEHVLVPARSSLIDPSSSSSSTTISADRIQQAPRINRGRQLQDLVATTPGVATENNGLLHVRGIEDGILYVVDGIPIADRLDSLSATSLDIDTISSLEVISGSYPAEFGGRNGAVVVIQPRSGIDQGPNGSLRAGLGDFHTRDIAAGVGSRLGRKAAFFLNAAAYRSDRYLDPVDQRNFNNEGGAVTLSLRGDWHPDEKDTILLNGSANGTDFDVTNDLKQELNGQRQQQELRDETFAASWQHVFSERTVANVALFYRRHESRLFGSENDLPIFAAQDRAHTRTGLIGSLTHQLGGHTLKAGIEASRVAPREFFTFYITDRDEAAAREVSDEALKFDRDAPFVFRDRRVRSLTSAYIQDQVTPLRNLTVHLGLRYDGSNLLVSDRQFSPRLGAVYHVPRTRTALRASFNRLFQPPQVDNLLLSSSAQAHKLSPFAGSGEGGAEIHPEKVSAWEAGFAQDFGGWLRLDAVYWHRSFRNAGDPNVFFNTTVIFPNSVASGYSRGVDVRLDIPERRGVSGWLSYTNMRILQTGPLNGGLFLTDDFVAIGPGVRFIPDQDQRNTGAFGISYRGRWAGVRLALTGRHESGVPLEVDRDRLDYLKNAPGNELVNFERGRVKPRTLFNLSAGIVLCKGDRFSCRAQVDVLNLGDRLFAYNFGNPFEGTHFGYGRRWNVGLKFEIR